MRKRVRKVDAKDETLQEKDAINARNERAGVNLEGRNEHRERGGKKAKKEHH